MANQVELETGKPLWWTTDDWETPPSFVRQLERRFGKFELDPCATKRTAKAPRYYSLKRGEDGLKLPWNGRVFLNPPYSDPLPWVRRAAKRTSKGICPIVVALLPCCFDTGWFHDWVLPYTEIHFIRGRIKFHGWQRTPIGSPRQPNFIAVYRDTGQDVQKPIVYRHLTFDVSIQK